MPFMKLTRFAKAILYILLTAVLLALSSVFQTAMHTEGKLEEHYFQSNSFLFIFAAVLLGSAVYAYLSYTRRHREHLSDNLILFAVGLALMVTVVTVVLSYGGLEGPFTESGYTAVNINIIVLSVLPLPFWIRAGVLAFSTREDSRIRRRIVQTGFFLLTAAVIVLAATGCMWRMERYTQDGGYDTSQLYNNENLTGYEEGGADNV